jgi:hypothetical protein
MPEPASAGFGLVVIAKTVGAMIGSGLALSVLAPQKHKDAIVRGIVGVVFGFVFSHPAYHFMAPYIGDAGEIWNIMEGACAAGFASWSIISLACPYGKPHPRWHERLDRLG